MVLVIANNFFLTVVGSILKVYIILEYHIQPEEQCLVQRRPLVVGDLVQAPALLAHNNQPHLGELQGVSFLFHFCFCQDCNIYFFI